MNRSKEALARVLVALASPSPPSPEELLGPIEHLAEEPAAEAAAPLALLFARLPVVVEGGIPARAVLSDGAVIFDPHSLLAVAVARAWLASVPEERAQDALDFLHLAGPALLEVIVGALSGQGARGAIVAVAVAAAPFPRSVREQAIGALARLAEDPDPTHLPAEVARAGLHGLRDDDVLGGLAQDALARLKNP